MTAYRTMVVLLSALALSGCASTPVPEVSLVDSIAREQHMISQQSCAAAALTWLCVGTARLDRTRNCSCVNGDALRAGPAGLTLPGH